MGELSVARAEWPVEGDLVDRLVAAAERTPDRLLYAELLDGVTESARLTARQLRDGAGRVAGALTAAGVRPGEVVLLIATPPAEFLVGLFGCLWSGVLAAPVAFPRRVEHLTTRLEPVRRNAGATAVLAGTPQGAGEQDVLAALTGGLLPVIGTRRGEGEAVTAPVADRDVAYLQYTSGSTSDPRGVIVTHANLLANLEVCRTLLGYEQDSVNVSWCPLTHDMGLIMGALPSVAYGMLSVLLTPSAFIRRPMSWMRAIDRYRGTHGYSPNFGYDLCVDRSDEAERATLDLSCAQVLVNGAEPVRRRTRDRFVQAFAVSGLAAEAHTPAYGLAEASVLVSATPSDRAGRVYWVAADALERDEIVGREAAAEDTRELCGDGVLGPGYDARIVDPLTRRDVGPGRVGELWISGPSVCRGYWRRPEETRETFGATLAGGDGTPYLRTGDLAYFAGDELVICGRAKDLIVIHGRNLYPQDIELTAESAHEAVRSGGSAAFAVECGDEETLVVVAEVNGEPDSSEVTKAISVAVLRDFELHLHDVLLVAPFTVPKTSSGKKQRTATRRLWHEARTGLGRLATADVAPAAR